MEISPNFLHELFLLFFRNKNILETCVEHLKYSYLPNENYKEVWKYIYDYYAANKKLPSIGIISQAFLMHRNSKEINDILSKINDAQLIDVEDCVLQLESYIKDVMSSEFYDEYYDIYTSGDKEKARQYMKETADKISTFSVKRSNYYTTVFGNFHARNRQRILDRDSNVLLRNKVPFSIDELDHITGGGIDKTETSCLLASSGVGKTKFLRWQGLGAARRKFMTLHIQAEGSEQACLEGYDAMWTAILMDDIKEGSIPFDKYNDLERVIRDMGNTDIIVRAFEQFTSGSMTDVRNILSDCNKNYGYIDLVIIDYLERMEPGDGKKYSKSYEGEKMRRSAIADKMKNLALEFGTRISTATQANDIPPEKVKDPKFVLTRHNVALAKNLPESFSYFMSLNQTPDEKKKGLARIYGDKFRFNENGQIIRFYTNFEHDRFYDRQKTLNELYKK